MHHGSVALFLTSLTLLPGCTKPASAAGSEGHRPVGGLLDKVKEIAATTHAVVDLSKAKATLEELTQTLRGLDSGRAATAAKSRLETLLATLQQQVGGDGVQQLRAKFGSGGDGWVQGAIDEVGKVAKNPEVQKVVGPLLEQLQRVLSGK